MKKFLPIFALALLTGCASVRVCHKGETMVDIENTGWYLLGFIPIATGNPDAPNRCSCRPFRDSLTLDNNARILNDVSIRENAQRVEDVVSYTTDEHVFVFLLKRKVFHTSARIIK